MKLKLDENLGRMCAELLRGAGHDVATVFEQEMNAAADEDVIRICAEEGRALVTLDLDFSNPLVFPPREYGGIAVLRLPPKGNQRHLVDVVKTLLEGFRREEIVGKLWSVESGRIRIYQPLDDE